jgi:hypothetical protein
MLSVLTLVSKEVAVEADATLSARTDAKAFRERYSVTCDVVSSMDGIEHGYNGFKWIKLKRFLTSM